MVRSLALRIQGDGAGYTVHVQTWLLSGRVYVRLNVHCANVCALLKGSSDVGANISDQLSAHARNQLASNQEALSSDHSANSYSNMGGGRFAFHES